MLFIGQFVIAKIGQRRKSDQIFWIVRQSIDIHIDRAIEVSQGNQRLADLVGRAVIGGLFHMSPQHRQGVAAAAGLRQCFGQVRGNPRIRFGEFQRLFQGGDGVRKPALVPQSQSIIVEPADAVRGLFDDFFVHVDGFVGLALGRERIGDVQRRIGIFRVQFLGFAKVSHGAFVVAGVLHSATQIVADHRTVGGQSHGPAEMLQPCFGFALLQ